MKTKEEAIERLENMFGCTTAMRTKDANGNNESYTAIVADLLLGNLINNDWTYMGCKHATAENTDISVWAQEMNDNCISSLEESLKNGELDIISFYSDNYGSMDIIVW